MRLRRSTRGQRLWAAQEARLAGQEAERVARHRAEDAKLPAGMWTEADFDRVKQGDSDGRQLAAAIRAGHLRALGIGESFHHRPCGLHGDACGLDRSERIAP